MEYLQHARVEISNSELVEPEAKITHENNLLHRLMVPLRENTVFEYVENPFSNNSNILIANAAILPVDEYARLLKIESKYLDLVDVGMDIK